MSLMAEKIDEKEAEEQKKKYLTPIGLHEAILVWIVDLGEQETPWGWKPQVMLTFELCKQLIEIEGEGFKPKVISTKSISPFITNTSNLGKLLWGWFGKLPEESLDLRKLAGQHCMINVVHNDGKDGKIYANIGSIAPPTDECKKIDQHHDTIIFEMGKDQLPQDLPDWIKAKIMSSRDWLEGGQQNDGPTQSDIIAPPGGGVEDLPF